MVIVVVAMVTEVGPVMVMSVSCYGCLSGVARLIGYWRLCVV